MARIATSHHDSHLGSWTYGEWRPPRLAGLVELLWESRGTTTEPQDRHYPAPTLELLVNLELFARLGLLNRYPQMMAHLEWWQGQQSKEGRWNLPAKLLNESSRWTALIRLEKDWRSPARKEADLTFRVLLILRYQWERQIRMLDRRDDGYTI